MKLYFVSMVDGMGVDWTAFARETSPATAVYCVMQAYGLASEDLAGPVKVVEVGKLPDARGCLDWSKIVAEQVEP
jgi:putative hemolysin